MSLPLRESASFSLDVLAKISNRSLNVIAGPSSIATCLSLVAHGARGSSHQQLSVALGGGNEAKQGTPLQSMKTEGVEVRQANFVYSQKDFPVETEYVKEAEKHFKAKVKNVDFVHDAKQAVAEINGEVSTATNGKIQELLSELDQDTKMVLVNACYFYGKWLKPFKKMSTDPQGDFKAVDLDGKVTEAKTPTMRGSLEVRATKEPLDDGIRAIQLPYKDESTSMLVIIPGKIGEVDVLCKKLNAAVLVDILAKLQSTMASVSLPKFRLTSGSLSIVEPLKAMGIKDAFDEDNADFTGISPKAGLYVSDVIHSAFVDVDEEGTEAAAATAAIMMMRAALIMPSFTFNVDEPFVFLILANEDKKPWDSVPSGPAEAPTVLFGGVVRDPRSK